MRIACLVGLRRSLARLFISRSALQMSFGVASGLCLGSSLRDQGFIRVKSGIEPGNASFAATEIRKMILQHP
uniref:Uncharacterized protein n=1 Tax=Candidatus Kentrum sp. SD TaxID=2126332 RepID=A0A451BML0_9GAMM|nr:MAG: hypothetical protein BECKSD772D_GA0070982_105321 [Candidatus Kentron sp. SD]